MSRFKHHLSFFAAVAALSSAVQAQSSVTVGGRLDVGYERVNDGVGTVNRVDSGNYTASRLIFRGTEDLGGGMSAGFYLEHRFNADLGAQQSAAKFWNAGTQVSLSSKAWGSVTLGRQYVPIFWSFLFADDTGPLRLHGYSAVQSVQRSAFARVAAAAAPVKAAGSLDSVAGGVYQLSITSAFEDNLIVYKTPSMSGLTAMLAIGAPEGSPSGSGRVLGANVEYRSGPLYASAAANTKRGRVPAGGSGPTQTVTEYLVSGMYSVTPQLKLWGNIHPWKEDSAGIEMKGRDWMAGVSYWFPQSMLWVNYADKKQDSCANCGSKGFGVGYHYFLSKRTELYTAYGSVTNQANSGNSLNGFAPGALGKNVNAFTVGVAHQF
jgi:GBP family porin